MAAIQTLGRYQLERVLGKGAMGVVYEALDPKLHRKIAIKTILKSHLDEETAREYSMRFVREAQAVARLNHPNIVQVYDFGEEGDVAYLAMELIRGKELKAFFDANERFELKEVVRIMCELLDALDFAHNAGIIHRDIKPANVMLDAQGRAKLTDFGVARLSDVDRTHAERTQAGTMVGTPAYMSPEQVQGQAIDRRTDIFSSGVILYQFLTGKKPFTGEGAWTIAKNIIHENPALPSSFDVSLSPEYDKVVNKALAKNPEHRFASGREFAHALRGIIEGRGAEIDSDATLVPDAFPIPGDPAPGARVAPTAPEQSRSSRSAEDSRPSRTASQSQEVEVEFWRSIKDSTESEDFDLYVQQFPQGAYAALARRKIEKLQRGTAPAPTGEDSGARDRQAEEADAARREAEAQARQEAEENARRVTAETARREMEARARREAEERSQRLADEKARHEAEAKAKREAEEKAKRLAEEKARQDAEAKAKREGEEIAKRLAEEKARQQAEVRARREAEEKIRRDIEDKAKRDDRRPAPGSGDPMVPARGAPPGVPAGKKSSLMIPAVLGSLAVAGGAAYFILKPGAPTAVATAPQTNSAPESVAALATAPRQAGPAPAGAATPTPAAVKTESAAPKAPAQAEPSTLQQQKRDAEDKARRESESKAQQAADKARRDTEERAQREADNRAKRAAEETVLREAQAKREAEDKLRREAAAGRERAKQEGEERARGEVQAKREADDRARREADVKREAEEKAKLAAAAKAEATQLAKSEPGTPPPEPAKAAANSGALYQKALEIERDGKISDAVRVLKQAANAGSGPAAKRLGDIYGRGEGDVSRDYLESLKWYNLARQRGESVPTAKGR